MSSTARGLRLLKAIEMLPKVRADSFDNRVFEKLKITSISNGQIKGSLIVEPGMCNLANFLHGGYISSVIDVMTYYAQMSQPDGRTAFTTSMCVDYISPAKPGDTLTLETQPLRSGSIPVVEVHVRNETGTLIARGLNNFVSAEKYHKAMKDLNFDIYKD